MTFTRDAACLRLFYFGQIFSAVAERRFRIPNTPWTTECLIPNDSLSRGIAALAPDLAHPRSLTFPDIRRFPRLLADIAGGGARLSRCGPGDGIGSQNGSSPKGNPFSPGSGGKFLK